MYSERLNEGALSCLKYAVLLHLLIGIWMFSAQNSLGTNMFPRPINSNIFAFSEVAFNQDDSQCALFTTVEACLAANSKGCAWVMSASNHSCIFDAATGGPLQPLPRLFNDLTFPYLVLIILCAAGIIIQWTPLWPFISAIRRPILNMLGELWLFGAAPENKKSKDKLEMPTYSQALQTGLFGSAPPSYDLTLLSPYDQVCKLLKSRHAVTY